MINICRTLLVAYGVLLYMAWPELPATAATEPKFIGVLRGVEDMSAFGWAADQTHPEATAFVDVYIDAPAGQGLLIGHVAADQPSPDDVERGISGSHGFRLLIPHAFRDARSHRLYAYVVQTNGTRLAVEGTPRTFSFACSVMVCTSLPIASDRLLKVRPAGKIEIVYDHSSGGCYDHLPDVPPRAFRDATATVHLIASQITAYRMSGPSLDSVQSSNCQPIMESRRNPSPLDETYHEWLSSLYTLNGEHVYGLVHNEWYPSLVDHRCDPDFNWKFRINSITLTVSTDGGRTFNHPTNYKLFRGGSPWKATYSCRSGLDDYVYGPAEPSNIVRFENYYYMVFHQGVDPALHNEWGVCLARTYDISRSDYWQLWTRRGWVDGLRHLCDPISRPAIGDMHTSITYNTHLKKFVLVGCKYYPFDGVYLSTCSFQATFLLHGAGLAPRACNDDGRLG
jgi:hypothetical protein